MGYGAGHGAMWRSLLDRLEKSAGNPAQEAAAIEGAMTTFLVFENWMDGWDHALSWEHRRNGRVNQPAHKQNQPRGFEQLIPSYCLKSNFLARIAAVGASAAVASAPT